MSRIPKDPRDRDIPGKTFITTWCDECRGVQIHEERATIVNARSKNGVINISWPELSLTCTVCVSVKVTK